MKYKYENYAEWKETIPDTHFFPDIWNAARETVDESDINPTLEKLLKNNDWFREKWEQLNKEAEDLTKNYVFDRCVDERDVKLVTDSFMGEKQHSELHKINDKYLLIIHYDIGHMPNKVAEKYLKQITTLFDEKLAKFFGEDIIYVAVLPYRK